METRKNYILVGSFVLGGLVAILLFALWLTSHSEKHEYQFYQVRFHESVSGMSLGSPVKYRGVNVGTVDDIRIDHNEVNTIIARVRLLKGSPVKKDTVATLKLQGITGTSYIELAGGNAASPDIEGNSSSKGDLPEILSKFSDIATLSNELPELLGKTNYLATQAGRMVDDENLMRTHNILRRWDKISELLEKESEQLDVLMKNTNHLVDVTDKVMTQIEESKLGNTLQNLNETSGQLRELSVKTNQSAEVGFDTLNQLLIDAKKTSKDIRYFTRNMNENPSQIIFPKQEKQENLQ